MKSIVFAAPALPDGVENLRRTAEQILGPRRSEFDDFHARMRITKEHWYVQETPDGPIVLVSLEGHDLGETFAMLATSEHPFDVWFRGRAKTVHGIDFAEPMPGPLPEHILTVDR